MYSRVVSEAIHLKFDLVHKLTFHLPQHYPAIKRIKNTEIHLRKTDHFPLLNLIFVEALVEVEITYMGIDHQLHTLLEEVSFIKQEEQPQGNVANFTCLGIETQKDWQVRMSEGSGEEKNRVRQFDLIFLCRLLYHLSYSREMNISGYEYWKARKYGNTDQRGRGYQGRQQYQRNHRKSNPWKRIQPNSRFKGE